MGEGFTGKPTGKQQFVGPALTRKHTYPACLFPPTRIRDCQVEYWLGKMGGK